MGAEEDPHGVSLEDYTAFAVAIFGKPEPEWPAIAQAHGIPPDHMHEVIDAWTARFSDPATLMRHNELYQQGLVAAGVQRPEVSLEQYASMMKAMGAGAAVQDVCAQNGMTVQQWAMVNQHMGEEMMRDPSLAIRYAQLIGVPGAPPAAG